LMVQLLPPLNDVPQLDVSEKELAFTPPIVIPLMLNAAFPGLDSVTVCGELGAAVDCEPKFIELGVATACGAVPVPDRETVCGEPAALSLIESAPADAVAVTGVKPTEIEQEAPPASWVPQVFVCENPLPLATIPLKTSAWFPPFLSVTVCVVADVPSGTSPKLTVNGERVAEGAELLPVPLRATDCGVPAALSATVRLAERLPVVVGVSVTLMIQLAPAATLEPQVEVCEKLAAFTPLMAIAEMFSGAKPVFISVTV